MIRLAESRRRETSAEIRDLMRWMSAADPLWDAPRIHGKLLKLDVNISQATVARYLLRRLTMAPRFWYYITSTLRPRLWNYRRAGSRSQPAHALLGVFHAIPW